MAESDAARAWDLLELRRQLLDVAVACAPRNRILTARCQRPPTPPRKKQSACAPLFFQRARSKMSLSMA
eukprot:4630363-Alexandrium_andersonii.AAC.1